MHASCAPDRVFASCLNEMGQPWLHGWPVFAAEGDVLTVNPWKPW
ncbi:hypothetical protein SFOMI_3983 [Sphingobium fuliginis]|uniref:Uncharacterized protein n=1 Tax=Sphingobium fuliginis (strain ATCC 27551) TaxID=336203 RepID=A0A292ZKM5_SPHSA|nr:hypothetical protein SFOMI_3983 [Sphingobium fuliginis]